MSTSPFSTRSAPLGYTARGNRYDECVDPSGKLRARWADFLDHIGADPAASENVPAGLR